MKTEEKFFLGALIGSALGAVAALLFTPESGRNLRRRILNNLYRPLKIPKRKIFSPKRSRSISNTKIRNRSTAEGKAPTTAEGKARKKTPRKTFDEE